MSAPIDPSIFDPPDEYLTVIRAIEEAGHEAWAVGGALRDCLYRQMTGVESGARSDWDIATSARPEEILERFRRTVPLGIEHGTVGVLTPAGTVVEVTTFRRDIETDGRHAVVTYAETIDEDVARRDFTINAIAWRPETDEVRDPFDGRGDLEQGILRAVGEASERFREDYLRVLRGLRFAGRFDLEIEADTRAALVEAVAGLERLSAERVREELMKVLADDVPSTALDLYAECGALGAWMRELEGLAGDRAGWRTHLATVDAIRSHRPLLRLARLLSPVAEDPDERAETADTLMTRLRFSNAEARDVARLVRGFLPFVSPMDSAAATRSWLSRVGDAWRDLFRLHIGGARAAWDERRRGWVVAVWRRVHGIVLEAPPLALSDLAIDGSDVLELGVPSGPIVGLLLEELLEQVLEDPDRNEREPLLAEAARLVEIGALAGPRPEGGGPSGASDAPGGARDRRPG